MNFLIIIYYQGTSQFSMKLIYNVVGNNWIGGGGWHSFHDIIFDLFNIVHEIDFLNKNF